MGLMYKFQDVPEGYSADKSWEFDKLGRWAQIQPLERLVLSIKDQSFVVALDSEWGTGKSMLLQMWSDDLKMRPHPCVMFSAWETDYAADPLVAFSAEIIKQIRLLGVRDDKKILQNSLVSFGKRIPNALKVGLAKWLGVAATCASATAVPSSPEIAQATGASVESVVLEMFKGENESSAIQEYVMDNLFIEQFKESLADVVSAISNLNCRLPLIIFVDELDRCRPNYAIALMERVKHLFNIPGIVFILALDKQQLGQTVKCVYGLSGDSNEAYLRRFIDFDFRLPNPNWVEYVNYLYSVMMRSGWNSEFNDDFYKELFLAMREFYNLSARDLAQICTQLGIILRAYDVNGYEFCSLVVLVSLRKKVPRHFYLLIENRLVYFWADPYGSENYPEDFKHLSRISAPNHSLLLKTVFNALTGSIDDQINKQKAEITRHTGNKEYLNAQLDMMGKVKIASLNIDSVLSMIEFSKGFDK